MAACRTRAAADAAGSRIPRQLATGRIGVSTPVSRISPNLPGGNLRDNAFARRPV